MKKITAAILHACRSSERKAPALINFSNTFECLYAIRGQLKNWDLGVKNEAET